MTVSGDFSVIGGSGPFRTGAAVSQAASATTDATIKTEKEI